MIENNGFFLRGLAASTRRAFLAGRNNPRFPRLTACFSTRHAAAFTASSVFRLEIISHMLPDFVILKDTVPSSLEQCDHRHRITGTISGINVAEPGQLQRRMATPDRPAPTPLHPHLRVSTGIAPAPHYARMYDAVGAGIAGNLPSALSASRIASAPRSGKSEKISFSLPICLCSLRFAANWTISSHRSGAAAWSGRRGSSPSSPTGGRCIESDRVSSDG